MKRLVGGVIAACVLAMTTAASAKPEAKAAPAPAPAKAPAASPVADVKVDIPYTRYVLKNGLTLIVHEDHKAPIVAINIWYHVGAKNEPHGRTGFAHLFEHLMFTGSEHHPGKFNETTERVGATNQNGTTNEDRTNYFENVPTGALDTVLWLEADRMGFLLGSIDQKRLDEQRGVVQNEKRQDENQPYAVSDELITRATYPADHPYGHTVIGSMDDLSAARLEDVKDWFRTYYGPSNAILVLAGDITPAEARAKVEKYFGDIPPGPPVSHPKVWIGKRTGEQRETAYDRVPQPRLYMVWNTPQAGSPDSDSLGLLADVLSSDKTSRLYKRLVFQEQIATSVGVFQNASEIGGQFYVTVTGKPGGDLNRIEAVVKEEMAKLLAEGPTPDEMDKAHVSYVSAFVRGLERTGGFGGKSDQLARSEAFLGSPDAWKASFERYKSASGAEVTAAGRRWLSDGAYVLQVLPFPNYAAAPAAVDHTKMPEPAAIAPPHFPRLARATLSNGMKVVLAERHETPVVWTQLILDGGSAVDPADKPGLASVTAEMMTEGTTHRDSLAISDAQSRLNAGIGVLAGPDYINVNMSTLKSTLDPALDLYADVVMNPAFNDTDLARIRRQRIATLQREKASPQSAALRLAPMLAYGPGHPYGEPVRGTEASVVAMKRDDLARYHQTWFHPNGATIVVVGDTTMAELLPKLEKAFAGWKPGVSPAHAVPPAAIASKPVVYLVDKPGAIQSVIVAAVPAPARGAKDDLAITEMNAVLGGAFISRLNLNLREDKHWSYGSQSLIRDARGPRLFLAIAPVQTDKTKESLVEMRNELNGIVSGKPVTAAELTQAQNRIALGLPGRWETDAAVAGSIVETVLYKLPEDYWDAYAGRVRAVSLADVNRVAGAVVKNQSLVWVIVGDRAKIEQGVRELNLGEVRIVDADGKPVN